MSATCGTGTYLQSRTFVSNSSFNGAPVAQILIVSLRRTIFGLLFSRSLWPLSLGMLVLVTQMLSSEFPYTYLGLILSLYLVGISCFVVLCILFRLHQSRQAHSTTLVNDIFYIQRFYVRCDYVKKA